VVGTGMLDATGWVNVCFCTVIRRGDAAAPVPNREPDRRALFTRERQARSRDETDLGWLAAQSSSGRWTTSPRPG